MISIQLYHHCLNYFVPVIFVSSLTQDRLLLLRRSTTVPQQEKRLQVHAELCMSLRQRLHPLIFVLPSLDEVLNWLSRSSAATLKEEVLEGLFVFSEEGPPLRMPFEQC